MNKQTDTAEKFEYKAEMKQLLHLIIHSLYTHPEVFLRELISNSSDALNKIRIKKLSDNEVLDPNAKLEIKITLDEKEQTFSIEDAGIGMTKEELLNNIGTIARSGTLEFLENIKEQKENLDESLIGQFGVGFYSVFMVTDEVTIETRSSSKDSKGLRWKSSGEGNFTIEEIDKETRGTKISFKLKDSSKEFATEYRITEIIKKYSNFVEFPILIGEKQINDVTAIWHKKSKDIKENELEEFYKFLSNDYNPQLGHLHISLEGAVNFKSLIFIPKQAPRDLLRLQNEKSMHLYSNKILIQNDCKEIIPEYLRFVKGVVDTTDLPLNVSREVTQNSPAMIKIQQILTTKILALLKDWSENDQEKYKQFYTNFGPLLKTGINVDYGNRDKIIDLLRFESSTLAKDEMTSLKEYVSRMKKNQKEIYYLSGENRLSLENNPNLEYFKKNEIEVLLLIDPIDIFTVPTINEFDKKPIKSIDKAEIDELGDSKIETPKDNLSESLLSAFKENLADKVEDVIVSKRLVDSAVTLVIGKEAMDTQMEKMMKMMDKSYSNSKKIMEINMAHPVIKNLSTMYLADNKNPLIKKYIDQLYEGALLIEGNLNNPAEFVKRMTEIMSGKA